jgi:hypothetical protein
MFLIFSLLPFHLNVPSDLCANFVTALMWWDCVSVVKVTMQARTEKIRPVLGCPDLGLCGKWMVTPTHTTIYKLQNFRSMGGCSVYSTHEFCHNLLHKTCTDILKQLKMIVFWNIVTCSLTESDSHFKLHTTSNHHPEDGGSTHRWNVGLRQWDYMPLYPGKLLPSYMLPPQQEISHFKIVVSLIVQ